MLSHHVWLTVLARLRYYKILRQRYHTVSRPFASTCLCTIAINQSAKLSKSTPLLNFDQETYQGSNKANMVSAKDSGLTWTRVFTSFVLSRLYYEVCRVAKNSQGYADAKTLFDYFPFIGSLIKMFDDQELYDQSWWSVLIIEFRIPSSIMGPKCLDQRV